jgi:transcriptional regulator with XRE-family HTH domain
MSKRNRPDRRSSIGALMRELRLESGLFQAELAEQLGRTQAFVSRYERDMVQLSFEEVAEICAVLGVSLEALAATWLRSGKGSRAK